VVEEMPEPTPEELQQAVKEKGEKREKITRIYPFGVNRLQLDRAIKAMRLPATTVLSLEESDLVLTTKSKTRPGTKVMVAAQEHRIPVHVIKKNVASQLVKFLKFNFKVGGGESDEAVALREVKTAIAQVQTLKRSLDINPQNAYLRRLQHQLVDEAGLHSESVGEGSERRLRLYP
jgi:hypothetical protein